MSAVEEKEKDAYYFHFVSELQRAIEEKDRIGRLLKDVAWYNFETVCKHWGRPWAISVPDSRICLRGARYSIKHKRGRRRSVADFPIYYEGILRAAPILPPKILLTEYQSAHRLVQELTLSCDAPYAWAPGGHLYEKLLRESPMVGLYESRRSSDATKNNGHRSQCGA